MKTTTVLKKIFIAILLACFPFIGFPAIYAVVVGVSEYDNQEMNLRFADDDARAFHDFLVWSSPGTPAANFTLLLDKEATRDKILQALKVQFSKAREGDKVIFYFSGHGQEGSLIPYDGVAQGNVLLHEKVKSVFRECEAGLKLCFVDACFAGSLKSYPLEKEQAEKVKSYYKDLEDTEIIVFLSSRSSEISAETTVKFNKQNSVFTYYLLKALYGFSDQDKDRRVTIFEMYKYVTDSVLVATNETQMPVLFGDFKSDRIIISF
jgi:uncharacterized caspase-like protein